MACLNKKRNKTMKVFEDIDWETWKPEREATLLFVVERGRILLILKKCGLGSGWHNGVGGRLKKKETPEKAAIREFKEEVGGTPHGVQKAGVLNFQMTDGLLMRVHVFMAKGFRGELKETEEAIPMWFDLDQIPYGQMWADDRVWMPWMLMEHRFVGNFLLSDGKILGCSMRV